jgi:hypothetical protein
MSSISTYIIEGQQTIQNTDLGKSMTIGSETINANGTLINPKYLSAMVANSVNPTNLNLVNALSVASATTSPAYTINLQSAPAGVGSLWGIDYETTTGEDLQFTTSSATAGVLFNTVGVDNTTRIKNGRVTVSGVNESAILDYRAGTWANTTNSVIIQPIEVKASSETTTTTITPTKVELLEPATPLKKTTININSFETRESSLIASTLIPASFDMYYGNSQGRMTATATSFYTSSGTNEASSWGLTSANILQSNIGLQLTKDDIYFGYNTGTLANILRINGTQVTNGTHTRTWNSILTGGGGGSQTLTQVLTAGNTAADLSIILTSASTNIRNTISNSTMSITDTTNFNKRSTFNINQWDLKETSGIFTQLVPSSFDMYSGTDQFRITASGLSSYNSTTLRTSAWGTNSATLMQSGVGLQITKDQIDLGWNNGASTRALQITSTTITNLSPALSKSWTSLLSIGTILQANVGSVSITGTRLCQCSLNGGVAIPAGTYMVSYMVVFGATTTTYTTGFATPTAPITDNSTPSGTLYQYGGTLVNNTGTTGSLNISASSVIVFSGTTGCAIGISVAPNQPITSAYLQAVRIA